MFPLLWTVVPILVMIYLINKYRRVFWIIIITFPRDINYVYQQIRINILIKYAIRNKLTVHDYFDKQVKKMGTKPCFFFEDEVWTYKKVQDESYKIANYFQKQGYKKGDAIALFMQNRPDYVTIWLGLSRIGVVTSLINFNLRFKALEHCVQTSKCKAIIFGSELSKAINDVIENGGFQEQKLFTFEDRNHINTTEVVTSRHINVTEQIAFSEPIPTICCDTIGINDVVLNIFTSGTTGLPKAVILTHMRVICWSRLYIWIGLRQDDVLITPLPLYHVIGGVIGVTTALLHGIPLVILKKFSASTFWDQCIKYNCTVSLYLGEIMRYLLNQPEKAVDKMHKVRKFFGGGVNSAILSKFIARFNKIKVTDSYGCTDADVCTLNLTGQMGACGFHPIWVLSMASVCIAKVDDSSKEIVRDPKTDLVKMAEIGETGEYLSKIIKGHPRQEFLGYTDKEATDKKIIRDVKTKGDAWFKTGDLLQRDQLGYLYFKDRSGDTFRWKGENVSTAEVEQVVTIATGMKMNAVYGVEIPNTEGKCGMVAIADPERTLDLEKLAKEVKQFLPKYAQPLFLRVIHKEINVSGTFKLKKLDLQKEGFNISKMQDDSIYFLKDEKYVSLDLSLYNQIITGSVRV